MLCGLYTINGHTIVRVTTIQQHDFNHFTQRTLGLLVANHHAVMKLS